MPVARLRFSRLPLYSMLDHHPDMQLKRLARRTAFEPRPVQ
ncbi:hypothetical protein B4099_1741 [Heyndrickxia coagulans]|uniref:Uncharacterized protein n=1 Tax=Heyndrickxia coagulans TaxID=1398 RepID=A0A150JXB2_HEYCO|nr:hypothetical protein B4099_1741 [Heyndrickxia coagulans]